MGLREFSALQSQLQKRLTYLAYPARLMTQDTEVLGEVFPAGVSLNSPTRPL